MGSPLQLSAHHCAPVSNPASLYKKLKLLTDGVAGGKPVRRRRAPAPATFVELVPPPSAAAECVIELEGPRGKLRIQWKGATAPDLAAYCGNRRDSDHAANAHPGCGCFLASARVVT